MKFIGRHNYVESKCLFSPIERSMAFHQGAVPTPSKDLWRALKSVVRKNDELIVQTELKALGIGRYECTHRYSVHSLSSEYSEINDVITYPKCSCGATCEKKKNKGLEYLTLFIHLLSYVILTRSSGTIKSQRS